MIRPIVGFTFLAVALTAFVYVETEAQAQALQLVKPFTGVVNKAIASTLGRRLNTLGFAANDPVYGATMAAAQTVVGGAVAAGSVAATIAAVGSSPVWLSVALGLGAAYEIYDFSVGRYEFRADAVEGPRLSLTSGTYVKAAALPPPPVPGVWVDVAQGYDYSNPGVGVNVTFPNDLKVCATAETTAGITGSSTYCGDSVVSLRDQSYARFLSAVQAKTKPWVSGTFSYGTDTVTGIALVSQSGPTKITCALSPLICPEGVVYSHVETWAVTVSRYSQCQVPSSPACAGDPTTTDVVTNYTHTYKVFNNPSYIDATRRYTANDAAAKLTDEDLASRADPELLAAIANKIWQVAAQDPAYNGAPYDAQNPITAADVMADIAAGLYPHPTNYDLLSLPSVSSTTVPVLDPAASPVEAPASDSVTVDLGPDPGIAAPGLEDVPTGQSIVAHVMGLLPSVSAFTLPAHTGECVMPSFDFFGHAMTMQGACDLVEAERELLSTLFTAIWGIAGLVTVLRA